MVGGEQGKLRRAHWCAGLVPWLAAGLWGKARWAGQQQQQHQRASRIVVHTQPLTPILLRTDAPKGDVALKQMAVKDYHLGAQLDRWGVLAWCGLAVGLGRGLPPGGAAGQVWCVSVVWVSGRFGSGTTTWGRSWTGRVC